MVPAAMTEAASPLAVGVVIAETYEIERQLGQGGMGEVWLARHLRLAGKQVAIKVLHVDRQLPQEAVARFKREAEIAARLEHPNIVQVLDFNTLPTGQPYLVMELLKGQSLAARTRGKVLALDQLSIIMRQVGAALQAAHRAGVVHRDLKPENIFLVPTALGDQVKVLDFGISKLRDSNTVQTTDSVLIGTPLYMSPEQALGNNRDVTPQSDLFSLGSISYELLTGQAPFFADNIAKVVFRIAYEKHPPLAQARPDLPAPVVAAVERALEKERDKRTPDIETFVQELTGQPLVDVAQDESSGVYTPGSPVTDSMASGETRAPSGARPLATPASVTPPAPVASSPVETARTVSGRTVMVAMLIATLVVAGLVAKVRMDNWAERAAYRASMVDAGWVMLEDGNFVKHDAGVSDVAPDAGAAIDAGAPELDAGLAAADAGAEPPRPATAVKAETPPTEQELELLQGWRTALEKGDADSVWNARNNIRSAMKTSGARRLGFELIIEAVCERHDNAGLAPILTELRSMSTAAQLKQARARCLKAFPDAASLW